MHFQVSHKYRILHKLHEFKRRKAENFGTRLYFGEVFCQQHIYYPCYKYGYIRLVRENKTILISINLFILYYKLLEYI